VPQIWRIGCGDIGLRVAKRINDLYQNVPHRTSALIRSDSSASLCEKQGLETLIHDLDKAEPLDPELFKNSQVYYFAPPPKTGNTDTRLKHFLNQLGAAPKRIVLISTTGVYGNSHGEWIDEETPVNPQTDRAKRRQSAEHQVQQWAEQYHREYIILRVPGIYAIDRLPLERLKKNLPVVQAAEAAYTNRIHADDLADICITAMQSNLTGEIFNTTDGHPGTMVDYFNKIADYAGLERPPQISLEEAKQKLSKGMLSYAMESRRIRNNKLLNLLKIKLQYPTISSVLK
jgi:nucleoside-diphosphate-sugar epimerase